MNLRLTNLISVHHSSVNCYQIFSDSILYICYSEGTAQEAATLITQKEFDPTTASTDSPLEHPLFTPKEVSRMLDKSLAQVYEAIHQGQLPSVKIGRYYVPRAALEHLFLHGRLPDCIAT